VIRRSSLSGQRFRCAPATQKLAKMNQAEDSGFMHQATGFDYQESQGRVEVVFVARDFQTSRGRVVGQLIVTVTQAR
jgi:hypothetical protein